jgi:hypothetical protein
MNNEKRNGKATTRYRGENLNKPAPYLTSPEMSHDRIPKTAIPIIMVPIVNRIRDRRMTRTLGSRKFIEIAYVSGSISIAITRRWQSARIFGPARLLA